MASKLAHRIDRLENQLQPQREPIIIIVRGIDAVTREVKSVVEVNLPAPGVRTIRAKGRR